MNYETFLAGKLHGSEPSGIAKPPTVSHMLFEFQRELVEWSLRRGKAALFCDTGLGKSRQQVEWLRHVCAYTRGRGLILAPLGVVQQTVREAAAIGVTATVSRDGTAGDGITITNYDLLHRFDPKAFDAVVLDESSCLKDFTSATRNQLIESFDATPFKLACTATPAPNDFTELGNHAEFLGVMSRVEMLATFFVHDGGTTQDWRLKGHAERHFWRWVSSWAAIIRKPSDLGYGDGGYALPPLELHEHVLAGDLEQAHRAGKLFVSEATTLSEQRAAKRASLDARVAACAARVAEEPDEQWLLWVELNDEGDALAAAIPGAVQVQGSDDREVKEQRLLDFAEGRIRVLVTKPSIASRGLNLQRCARMAFVGVSHSYEQFYQAIRRCWRFGQLRSVHVHVFLGEAEAPVLANLRRKQAEAERMGDETRTHVAELVRASVRAARRESIDYAPSVPMRIPAWLKGRAA